MMNNENCLLVVCIQKFLLFVCIKTFPVRLAPILQQLMVRPYMVAGGPEGGGGGLLGSDMNRRRPMAGTKGRWCRVISMCDAMLQ
jgi:hypothetical protein